MIDAADHAGLRELELADEPPAVFGLAEATSSGDAVLLAWVTRTLERRGLPPGESVVEWVRVGDPVELDHRSVQVSRRTELEVGPLRILPAAAGPKLPGPGVILLEVEDDPGSFTAARPRSAAFGSGLHPTTALVLERLVELGPVDRLLDVGSGTGILALAAARLAVDAGHTPVVVALDDDPTAARVTARNAALNGLERVIRVSSAPPSELEERFSVVVANIAGATLAALAHDVVRLLSPRGQLDPRTRDGTGGHALLILSGLRPDEVEPLARTYQHHGLHRVGHDARGDWARLELAPPW